MFYSNTTDVCLVISKENWVCFPWYYPLYILKEEREHPMRYFSRRGRVSNAEAHRLLLNHESNIKSLFWCDYRYLMHLWINITSYIRHLFNGVWHSNLPFLHHSNGWEVRFYLELKSSVSKENTIKRAVIFSTFFGWTWILKAEKRWMKHAPFALQVAFTNISRTLLLKPSI